MDKFIFFKFKKINALHDPIKEMAKTKNPALNRVFVHY